MEQVTCAFGQYENVVVSFQVYLYRSIIVKRTVEKSQCGLIPIQILKRSGQIVLLCFIVFFLAIRIRLET